MTAHVIAYDTANPGDVSDFSRNLARFEPARIRKLALLVKTEGNSDVNDFSREFALLSLTAAIEAHGGKALAERSTFLISTGCEGAMTPFGYLFVDLEDDAAVLPAKAGQGSALAFGCARSRSLTPEEIGTPAHAVIVAETVEAAMREAGVNARFYQASSSEMYGKVLEVPQSENTPFYPRSPYGVAKAYGHYITVNYRESYSLFACSGILFNHESPRRGLEFVTRKITDAVAKIKLGLQSELRLGNLDARRDWGFAGDYVRAMWLMLQQNKPEDFIIATGKKHSVRDIIQATLQELDFQVEWQGQNEEEICIDTKTKKVLIQINKDFYRPNENVSLIGDSSKAKKILKWIPKTSFNDLVYKMIKAEKDKNLI